MPTSPAQSSGLALEYQDASLLYTGAGLARTLVSVAETDYIRVVATWLSRVLDWETPVPLTDKPVVDAIVAAACGYAAVQRGANEPQWTQGRELPSFWSASIPSLFAWSFAHTPGSFKRRGVIVERDSLTCI